MEVNAIIEKMTGVAMSGRRLNELDRRAVLSFLFPKGRVRWQDEAQCVKVDTGSAKNFYSNRDENDMTVQATLRVCGQCAVRRECLAEDVRTNRVYTEGIMGGMPIKLRKRAGRSIEHGDATQGIQIIEEMWRQTDAMLGEAALHGESYFPHLAELGAQSAEGAISAEQCERII